MFLSISLRIWSTYSSLQPLTVFTDEAGMPSLFDGRPFIIQVWGRLTPAGLSRPTFS